MIRSKIIFLLLLVKIQFAYSQEWTRLYGDPYFSYTYSIVEHYDKGYVLNGFRYNEEIHAYGWLVKTDINGFERWSKHFGDEYSTSPLFAIDNLTDGKMITIGQTSVGSFTWSAHVIQVNACGEKEWCRIYHTPNRTVYGLDIKAMPGGGSIAMVGNWGYDLTKVLWLLRLNEYGDIVWEQAYALDSLFWGGEGYDLFRTSDTTFIITGMVYAPDSGQINPYKYRPLVIKVQPDGTADFELAWGTQCGYMGSGWVSTDDHDGNIFSGTQQLTYNPSYCGPGIIITSRTGEQIYYNNLVDTAVIGGTTTMNWFSDSTLAMGLIWRQADTLNDLFYQGVIKTDRQGNKLKFNLLVPLTNLGYKFNDALITFNNKLLIVRNAHYETTLGTKAFKLTSDLEYDSVYTTPFTYDSLCPHAINSDTIPLDDCEVVVVGIDEPGQNPEKTRLKVYPNPAGSMVTVEMPEYLVRTADGGRQTVDSGLKTADGGRGTADGGRWKADGGRQTAGIGITATTYYHQWKSVRLDVFDLFGKLMHSEEIPGKTDQVDLDISSWPAGMYVARIVFMNEVVGVAKFVKE